MFTKNQIDYWLELNKTGENYRNDEYFIFPSLKTKLLESKVLIDRWSVVTTDIIVHTSHKSFFNEELKGSIYETRYNYDANESKSLIKDLEEKFPDLSEIWERFKNYIPEYVKTSENYDHIWGARIHYSEDMPIDRCMLLSFKKSGELATENPARSIAVFPL